MSRTDWKFLRQAATIATVAGQSTITTPLVPTVVAAGLGEWDYPSFYYIDPSANGVHSPLETVEYQDYRSEVLDPNATGAPWRIVIMPDDSWRTDPPIPDAIYTIGADYHSRPVQMAADGDVSLIPPEFHEAILGKAHMYYGNFENAEDAKTQGKELFDFYMARLDSSQSPFGKNPEYRSGGYFEVIAQ